MDINLDTEPITIIVVGGTAVVNGFLGVLIAAGVHVTPALNVAIVTFATACLAFWARSRAYAPASLPPGVAAQIADNKTKKESQ